LYLYFYSSFYYTYYYHPAVSPLTAVIVFAPEYAPDSVPEGINIPHQVSLVVGVPDIALGTSNSTSVGVVDSATPEA
jgi:hypothetical protein